MIEHYATRALAAMNQEVRSAISRGNQPKQNLSLAAALEQLYADGATEIDFPGIALELRKPR